MNNKKSNAGLIVIAVMGFVFLLEFLLTLLSRGNASRVKAFLPLLFILFFALIIAMAAIFSSKKGKSAPAVPTKAINEQPVDQHDIWTFNGKNHVVCNPELCEDETDVHVKRWLLVILITVVVVIVIMALNQAYGGRYI